MKIGTVRVGEAEAYDSHAGYHQFHAEETQEPYGSFEVFWHDGERPIFLDYCVGVQPGWYWWACFPGCMPCGEPAGPFAYSQQAHQDADEWSPDYDEDSS